ncbi:MAG: hypothetical protein JXR97_15265, partial [Planctomycetes bacterium]|nr:hypothetical protein [Planctomycetota bacterium]
EKLAGPEICAIDDDLRDYRILIHAFKNAGYDYATLRCDSGFAFPRAEQAHKDSVSINEGCMIHDRESFEKLNWPDPDAYDYTGYERVKKILPEGMKLIIHSPCGTLENVVRLVGYENLCYMVLDEPDLAQDVFDAVGSRLYGFYKNAISYPTVGAAIVNDDWGFNTQTMLSPADMRKYVFPWHKKIVELIHANGKPAILHSCGNPTQIIDDVIEDMKYDGRHSYEDNIIPVEEAYKRWGDRIAIMGGIDVDFICRSSEEEITARGRRMFELAEKGGYALGTGNSVPEYVPDEKYLAMIRAAVDSECAALA